MADEQSEGGSAPPLPEQRNRAPDGLTREYAGDGIRVQWYAERCIHAAECIRALPGAFDPRRRPWIDLSGADADVVAGAVQRCPTGALHFTRTDGGPPEPVPEELTLEAVPGGPYYVRGPALVALEGGGGVREDTRMALCRCGKSVHMPFCDNSHRALRIRL